MNDDRLVEIETKIAFQEKIITDLNDTVYEQQKQIDSLEKKLKRLVDQSRDSSVMSSGGSLKDEKPPHY